MTDASSVLTSSVIDGSFNRAQITAVFIITRSSSSSDGGGGGGDVLFGLYTGQRRVQPAVSGRRRALPIAGQVIEMKILSASDRHRPTSHNSMQAAWRRRRSAAAVVEVGGCCA